MSFKKITKKAKDTDDKAKHSTNMPTIVKSYLDEKYDIRKNTISGIIEAKTKTAKAYTELNENDVFIEMHENNIKVGKDMLKAVLRSSFIQDHNPIIEYFQSLKKWTAGTDPDHIKKLCSFIKSENDDLFLLHLTKHLVRCIACVMLPNYFNKQCFVIVSPKQDIGKTSLIRFFHKGTPLEHYSTENIEVHNKDGRFTLTENIIINLDELAGMPKHEINQLKAFISYDKIKEREAYAAQKTTRIRIASFFATTNDLNFLNDLTGSSRWVCFQVFSLDWSYSSSVDVNKIWAQAFALFNSGTFDYNLTKDEKQANEMANQKHAVISPEQEAIQMFYEPSEKDSTDALFLSATEIAEGIAKHSTFKQTVHAIGRTLPKIGFKQLIIKHDGITKRGYYVRHLYGADTSATPPNAPY